MSWFGRFRNGTWDLARVAPPWGSGGSIYAHVAAHIAPGTPGLTDGGSRLPDEKDDGEIKFAPGALDGVFGHHWQSGTHDTRAKLLHRALSVVLEDASATKLRKLYEQLLQNGALEFIDPLLELILERQDLDPVRLEALALWLARNAPDREPVKFGIALLGVLSGSDHTQLLLALGRHDEFTLYAAVALSNSAGERAERLLFELAQQVDGWGRIQIVERLANTQDAEIKTWLLRDGYRNSVMYGYTAHTCAVAGDLRGAMEPEAIDPALFGAAGDLIEALLLGGPAETMDEYPDGAIVVERYLHHVPDHATSVRLLRVLGEIEDWLTNDSADWTQRADRGWTAARREALRGQVRELKGMPCWQEWVDRGLASEDKRTFEDAAEGAKVLGIDVWDARFRRLEDTGEDHWYQLMQTRDAARIDRVLALAEQRMPLDSIASGPRMELGFGLEWADHTQLDYVLQELRRFPHKAWPLIRAGLRSPVVRNRNMALEALSPWGMDAWPVDARGLLQAALREEPDDGVREHFRTLLANGRLDG